MQKITPSLWYNTEAKEAAAFYTSIFPGGKITYSTVISDTPSGTVELVGIEIAGYNISMISAGALFKFTPAISLMVQCATVQEVETLWSKLSVGGQVLMELGQYPFSEKFGWTQDKFGLSWQIMMVGNQPFKQKIFPQLMFVGAQCGRAEEAVQYYTKVFHNSKIDGVMRYGEGEGLDKPGTVKHAGFTLEGLKFTAMDSAWDHKFNFSEAISFEVRCDTQAEMDYFTEKLSAVPEAEQCGWVKDQFGVSWQIVPVAMDAMMQTTDVAARARVTQAMLQMKRLDLAALEKAARG